MSKEERTVSWEELGKHTTPGSCWVAIDQKAYDVTDFLVEHPGGDEILMKMSGLDATEKFYQAKHSDYAVSLKNARCVGKLETKDYPQGYLQKMAKLKSDQRHKKPVVKISWPISADLVKTKRSEQSCWIIIDNAVYDVTNYMDEHPGGVSKIMEFAGRDATKAFQETGHSLAAIKKKQEYRVGELAKGPNHVLIAVVALVLLGVAGAVALLY